MRRSTAGAAIALLVVTACGPGTDADTDGDGIEELDAPDDPAPTDQDVTGGDGDKPDEDDVASSGEGRGDETRNEIPVDEPVDDASIIDEAYVERVLEILDRNYVDLVDRAREIGVEEVDVTVYAVPMAQPAERVFSEDAETDAIERILEFEVNDGFQPDPAPVTSNVDELLTVTTDCVSLAVDRDASPLYAVPLDGRWYVALRPRDAGTDEAGTIWRFAGETPDTGEAVDECA